MVMKATEEVKSSEFAGKWRESAFKLSAAASRQKANQKSQMTGHFKLTGFMSTIVFDFDPSDLLCVVKTFQQASSYHSN